MHRLLWNTCKCYVSHKKWLFLWAFVCGCIYGLTSGLGLPLIFEKVFRRIFESSTVYSYTEIIGMAVLIPLGFALRGISGYLNVVLMNRCGLYVLSNLRTDVIEKLQMLQLSFFDRNTTGDLVHRVIADPKKIQDILLEWISEGIKQPLQMLAAFGSLIYLSIQNSSVALFLVFCVSIPFCFLPVRLLRSRVEKYSRIQQCTEGALTAQVSENLNAVQEVRLFNLAERVKLKIQETIETAALATNLVVAWQKLQQPIMEVVSAIIIAVVFTYAYCANVPFSVFSAMGMALYLAFDPIKRLNTLFGSLQGVTGSIERIGEILKQVPTIQSPENPYLGSCSGSITFQAVSFRYSNKTPPVIHQVDGTMEKHKFYALVGSSGAGKTTLIKLITRLYDVSDGAILMDGVDIRQWDLKHLRQQISIVSQSTILFNDTFLENLRLGSPNATREEIIEAAKMAYAHDFICKVGGYDSRIGENGNRLSGGQRQRLAIARAFLKQAPILILDEATSALDSESEALIKKSLDTIRKQKTVIAIAHRISTIQQADCIWVFEKGSLVGKGTHAELLKTNFRYQQLVSKQLIGGSQPKSN